MDTLQSNNKSTEGLQPVDNQAQSQNGGDCPQENSQPSSHEKDPEQVAKFIKRLDGLKPGRYTTILTVAEDGKIDWTAPQRHKVEQ